jgi:hypothetical protein
MILFAIDIFTRQLHCIIILDFRHFLHDDDYIDYQRRRFAFAAAAALPCAPFAALLLR